MYHSTVHSSLSIHICYLKVNILRNIIPLFLKLEKWVEQFFLKLYHTHMHHSKVQGVYICLCSCSFLKDFFYAHQACVQLITNTKTVTKCNVFL